MKFKEYRLSEKLKETLEKLGFVKPTDIQFKAIQPILDGQDVMAVAPTGTGKTAAYAIPIIQKLIQGKSIDAPRALILAPTRELAVQISLVFENFANGYNLNILAITGGVDQDPQKRELRHGVDVVICTPGRMFDLVSQMSLSLEKIKYLVVDEADQMLQRGFQKDLEDVARKLSKHRQTLFFTATIDKKIKALAYELIKDGLRIQVSPKDPVSKNIEHSLAFVEMDDKRFFLENIIQNNEESRIMVFARTKVRVTRVAAAMKRVGIDVIEMHGDKTQDERTLALDQFRKGEIRVLVCTDVTARGIDIEGVNIAVNYDLPDVVENYVHRIGRTGRGTAKGLAVSMCAPEEKQILKEIQDYIGYDIPVIDINKTEYKEILKATEDLDYNWKKLIDEANEEDGTKDNW
jgi:ATP-dependent RNA helicase RhlE